MTSQQKAIDYELALLELELATSAGRKHRQWQRAFAAARDDWRLERAQQLLRLAKGYIADEQAASVIRHLEGTLLVRTGEWPAAKVAFERALASKRATGDRQGELVVLTALANLLRRMEAPLTAVTGLLTEALALAEAQHDPLAAAAIYNSLGLACYAHGQLGEAESHYQQALAVFDTDEPAQRSAVLHNLGSLRWTQGQLSEAEGYFRQAWELQQILQDHHGQAETGNSLGLLYEARGDWAQAAAAYTDSLGLLQGSGDHYGQVQVLTNLGNLCWLQGEYIKALSHHEQALALAEELGDLKLQGQVLTGLGDTYRMLAQPDAAEVAFRNALAQKQAAGDQRSLKHTYLNLGSFYHTQHRFDQAADAYHQALALARQQADTRIEAFALLNLGKLAALQGAIEMAMVHLDAADRIAIVAEYWDCLADASRVRGDLELLQPESNAQWMLQCYAEACVHAANFNQKMLDEMVNYLVELWTAQAEDGYEEQAIWFCESMIALWEEVGYAERYPVLVQELSELSHKFH